MFIETSSQESMTEGICKYFNLERNELLTLFDKVDKEIEKNSIAGNEVIQDDIFENFIDNKKPVDLIDQIEFYHLSRRLNSNKKDGNDRGLNLRELLLTENEISSFLKEFGIEFNTNQEAISLIYKGKRIPLDNSENRLRLRLGYCEKTDYNFSGHALRDRIYINDYAEELSRAPEFISDIEKYIKKFLGEKIDMVQKFEENSTYFCFKYCVPLEKVVFKGKENLSDIEKQKDLIKAILMRLYSYHIKEESDGNNIELKLKENEVMESKYYIEKTEISNGML